MIEIKGLKKSFGGSIIFENVDLTIHKGETVVILGGSGCGKSTLLRCINQLEKPDAGQIIIGGEDTLAPKYDKSKLYRRLGMVYQSFNLFSHLNVMENMILAPMKVLGLTQAQAIQRADGLLKTVGMENRKYHMPSQLSGGQKQRVAIARALMMEPEVMLFDEPTSALDPTMVDEVESVIRRLCQSGMTCIIVTHEMRFARNVASKIVFLAEKGIYEQAPPEEFFEHPARELTRQFIYRSRMLEEKLTAGSVDIYELASKLRSFAQSYGYTREHARSVSVILDELIVPLMENQPMTLRFVASETGDHHSILLELPQAQSDPLADGTLDELNLILLRKYVGALESKRSKSGLWEISCTL